jgi:hypothetical protein
MKQTSITLESGKIIVTLTATRNPVSLQYAETLSLDMKGFPVITRDVGELASRHIAVNLVSPKTLHRLLKVFITEVPMELKEDPEFSRDWSTLLHDLLLPANQEQHQQALHDYQHNLLFKYEQHPNIAVRSKSIAIVLHEIEGCSNVVLHLVKERNREVKPHCTFTVKVSPLITRSASYTRYDGPMKDLSVVRQQVNTWTNAFEKRFKIHPDTMKTMRADIKQHLTEMDECVEDILERIKRGDTI